MGYSLTFLLQLAESEKKSLWRIGHYQKERGKRARGRSDLRRPNQLYLRGGNWCPSFSLAAIQVPWGNTTGYTRWSSASSFFSFDPFRSVWSNDRTDESYHTGGVRSAIFLPPYWLSCPKKKFGPGMPLTWQSRSESRWIWTADWSMSTVVALACS